MRELSLPICLLEKLYSEMRSYHIALKNKCYNDEDVDKLVVIYN